MGRLLEVDREQIASLDFCYLTTKGRRSGGPHTIENSFKKAFTSRTFRIPSGEMEERMKKNPAMGAQFLTGFTTGRGALPIKIGEEVVGAAGVSGAPGGEKDEACVQTGLDKVKDLLK